MIPMRHIIIVDDSIPAFTYKGEPYYLPGEDFKVKLAATLPVRESISYKNGDQLVKTPYQPTADDLTTDDIKKHILDNRDKWVCDCDE